MDGGEGVFGVTANHVIDGRREDRATGRVVALRLGNLQLDLDRRNTLIATHGGMDIATFRISPDEVASIGKTVLTGYQTTWPPAPPQLDRGVYYAGFPGVETLWLSPNEISFGIATGGGVASSISDTDVSSLIERENLIGVLGQGVIPENYDFRGMSGGPMLSVHKVLKAKARISKAWRNPSLGGDTFGGMSAIHIDCQR